MKLTGIILLAVVVVLQVGIIIRQLKWKRNFKTIFNLIESSKDVVYHYELSKMKFKYISPSIETFLGKGVIEEAIVNPKAPFERVHPDDHEILMKKIKGDLDYSQTHIQRWKATSGNYRWFEEYSTPIYENGHLVAIQGIMRNIDEKVKLQEELEYRIHHDPLTDIYNRAYFEKKFQELNIANVPAALIVCDLDDLKYVNDHFGHKAGDERIKDFAKLLNQHASDSITVARIGGDEFILVLTDHSEHQVSQLLADLHREIALFNSTHPKASMKMSVGYSYTTNSAGQMDRLFSQADQNMYMDKVTKKSRVTDELIV